MANRYWHRTRFAPLDTAWLHMDYSGTQTPIGGLLLLDEPVTLSQMKTLVRSRLLRFRRFRQRVREPYLWLMLPTWEDDSHFDLDAHVHSAVLDQPDDWASLRALYEDLLGMPLHPGKPLWQMHLVENYGKGSALIIRLEHAVADGIALMHVLETISDASPTAAYSEPAPEPENDMALHTLDTLLGMGHGAAKSLRSLPGASFNLARHPRHFVGEGLNKALTFGGLVLCPPDPKTILLGKRGTAHRVAFSEPLAVADVKAVGKALGGTINDVILSAVAGGFRHYLMERGEYVQDIEIRGIVPINLRDSGYTPDLGNEFGLAFLPLPVSLADPVERLRELRGRMDDLKQSPQAWVTYATLYAMGWLPRRAEVLLSRFFTTKASTVMTNVAGPAETRYLAGSRIDRIMFSVPHPCEPPAGMSIMSYDGTIIVTIDTDAGLIPKPEDIIAGFHADFAQLQRLAAKTKAKSKNGKHDGRTPEPEPEVEMV